MMTRTFLVGVSIGLLIAALVVFVADKVTRLERVEERIDAIVHALTTMDSTSEHTMSYGEPEQEAL